MFDGNRLAAVAASGGEHRGFGVTYEERIALKKRIDQTRRSRVNVLPPYGEQTEAERREYLRIKKQESRRRQRERSEASVY
jgi:hypothetical protein